jgi:hypothetical protein
VTAGADEWALRAGDVERDRTGRELRQHHLAGRLDAAELDERLGRAYGARTLGDLAVLLADLPELGPRGLAAPPRPAPPRPRAGAPGLVRFHQLHVVDADVREAYAQALAHVVPPMVRFGYDLVDRREGEALVFERSELPGWVPFACVFAFPFGLIALTARRTTRVRVDFSPRPERTTQLTVSGEARRPVRRAFAELAGDR